MPPTPAGIGQTAQKAMPGRDVADQRASKWWTLVAVCLGTFMLLLDITIVTVALPDIQLSLHSSFPDLQWVVDAYALTLAAFLLTAGGPRGHVRPPRAVPDRARGVYGHVRPVRFRRQHADAPAVPRLARRRRGDHLRGRWRCWPTPSAAKDRGVAFGMWGAVTGLAVALGPLIGGALTSGLSWRWIFFVNVPVGIAAVVLTRMKVAESRAPGAARPDRAAFVILTAALASLPEIAGAIQSGQIGHLIDQLPAPARQAAGTVVRAAFASGLDRILLVSAIIAFVAGVVSLAAIRSRDFAHTAPAGQEGSEK